MQYLIDAQLPRRLALWLQSEGYEATHTLELPDKNNTTDTEIIRLAAATPDTVIVSKDRDFPEQRIIRGGPERLLWITTGNINNNALVQLFEEEFPRIHQLFMEGYSFLELSNEAVTVHQ